LCKIFTWL